MIKMILKLTGISTMGIAIYLASTMLLLPAYTMYNEHAREQSYIDNATQAEDIPALYREGVVLIINPEGSRGTGTILEPGIVLTANHVPGNSPVVTVAEPKKGFTQYAVIARDLDHDIALLAAPGATVTRASIARLARNNPGDTIHAIGYGKDSSLMEVTGTDQGPSPVDPTSQFNADIGSDAFSKNFIAGQSGGPVFDDAGKIVSIVSRGSDILFKFSDIELNKIRDEYNDYITTGKLTDGTTVMVGYYLTMPSMGPSDEVLIDFITKAANAGYSLTNVQGNVANDNNSADGQQEV